jgi:pimeloyl-ACP methyl ester carboxylesterase
VNDQYWKEGGPVFYEIGGEGTLNGPPGGFIAQLASKYGALLIALEHRFYGESIPNGNVLTANYQYLTVEQALADLSSFTDYYKNIVPKSKSVPWFVFGGSYPGALSSWYRATYPNQSVGSLSSSGVVNCIIDFYQFDMSVSAAAGNTCSNNIHRISNAFQKKVESGVDGFNWSLDLFNCEHDMSHNDFYYMIADSWSMMIQYSSKTTLCDTINLPETASDEEVMTTFANLSNKYWGSDFCSGGFCKPSFIS